MINISLRHVDLIYLAIDGRLIEAGKLHWVMGNLCIRGQIKMNLN